MSIPDSPTLRRQARAHALAAMGSYSAMGVGAVVLVGWWLRIDLLKRVGEGMTAMNPLTEVCCILAGISLVLQVRRAMLSVRVLAAVIEGVIDKGATFKFSLEPATTGTNS